MQYHNFLNDYVEPFDDLEFIFKENEGFIVWRTGTGNNTELLHIQTFEKRKGYGKKLFLEMVKKLKDYKPYYSIYGFTRVDNNEAQLFYKTLGFNIENVKGLYKDGNCKLFWASYDDLYNRHFGE